MSIAKFAVVAAAAVAVSACGTRPASSAQWTVNGQQVSVALYNTLVAAERQKVERTGAQIDPNSRAGHRREAIIESSVIRELVRDAVVEQLAEADGISVSAADLQQRVSAAELAFGGPLAFEEALQQAGLSRTDFRSVLRYRLLEARLAQTGAAGSTTHAIDAAVSKAHVVVTVGPCASGGYPACVSTS